MPRCNHCESYVSKSFQRVFGDEHGQVYACPECAANAGIAEVTKHRSE